jgi:hypothetical protein
MGRHSIKGVTLIGSWWLSAVTTKVILYYMELPNYFDEFLYFFQGALL